MATEFSEQLDEDLLESGDPPAIGDRLVGVNGEALDEYFMRAEPYHRYSTVNGLWRQFAAWIPQRSYQFPPEIYGDELILELERGDGTGYSLSLPYVPAGSIDWAVGDEHRQYPGFGLAFSTPLRMASGTSFAFPRP